MGTIHTLMGAPLSLPYFPSKQSLLYIAALFIAIGVAVFGESVLRNAFVECCDDNYLIINNVHIKDLSLKNISYNFTHFDPELYIPITFLSYQIDYFLMGLDPRIFHATSLFLHIGNALMVAALMYSLFRHTQVAIFCGLLFAIHPLNVEAVAWISSRKDVLSTFFFLGSVLLYLAYASGQKRLFYVLSIIAFTLALLSKVVTATLPLLLIGIDWLLHRTDWKDILREKIPYAALSLIFGLVAIFGKQQILGATGVSEKILLAFKSIVFTLQKILLPFNLSPVYPQTTPIEGSSAEFFVPIVVVLLLVAFVLYSLKYTRTALFGFGFFIVMLLPSLVSFTKGGEIYFAADHYAYIPVIGIVLLIAWITSQFSINSFMTAIASCVLLILGLMTYQQTTVWRNSQTLLEHTVALYPAAIGPHLDLSGIYTNKGDYERAEQHIQSVLRQKPHALAYINLAILFDMKGQRTKAYEYLDNAQQLTPKNPVIHYQRGYLYQEDGRLAEAIDEYNASIAIDAGYLPAIYNLAALYFNSGNLDRSQELFEMLYAMDPYFLDVADNLEIIRTERGLQ